MNDTSFYFWYSSGRVLNGIKEVPTWSQITQNPFGKDSKVCSSAKDDKRYAGMSGKDLQVLFIDRRQISTKRTHFIA